MSYYWAVPGPTPAPTAYSVMGSQSSLHQERAYLLGALAAEESRGEQLTFSLHAARQKLAAAEHLDGGADERKKLKKTVTGLARKLKRSQNSSNAMINNLAAVTSRMQMLEQHQWRRAQIEYHQRSQMPELHGIDMTMQNLSLVSPVSPTYQYQVSSPISPQTPGFANPLPLTPMPVIQWASNCGDGWGSPLYTPFYAQPYERAHTTNHGPLQIIPEQLPNDGMWRDVEYTGFRSRPFNSRHLRSRSLPVEQRRASWAGTGPWNSSLEEEAISPKSGMNLVRRLSLIGAASAGLRLERLVE